MSMVQEYVMLGFVGVAVSAAETVMLAFGAEAFVQWHRQHQAQSENKRVRGS